MHSKSHFPTTPKHIGTCKKKRMTGVPGEKGLGNQTGVSGRGKQGRSTPSGARK